MYQIKFKGQSLKYEIVKEDDVEMMDALIEEDQTITDAFRYQIGNVYDQKYYKSLK